MKTFAVFACLLLGQLISCETRSQESNLAVAAIRELVTKYFVKNCPKIDLLIVGTDEATQSTANDLVRWMPPDISLQVSKKDDWTGTTLNTSSILLCGMMKNGEELPEIDFVDDAGVWHKHLVYAPGLTADDISENFPNDTTISEVNFLINGDNKSIELATAFMFTPDECHQNQVKTINRFTRTTKRWDNTNFYPDKYQNFHGCPIEVKYTVGRTNSDSQKIFETLADQLNFTLQRKLITLQEFRQLNMDITMTESIVTQPEGMGMLSSTLFFDDLAFIVPPGKPLTELERMFAAFDDETWIGIGATFAFALAVIQFIKFMPIEVQHFVFGRNIRTPILNLFSNFLAGSQSRVPGRNFARYLLTMWCLWCLIFRTCYQSKMFEHMNSDMRHPRIRTIDELIEKNFTFVADSRNTDWYERLSGLNVTFTPDGMNWFDTVPEPANKMAYLIFRSHYFRFVIQKIGNIQPSTHILDKNLVTIRFYLAMPRYIPYTRVFKEKIDQMLSSGMIQEWHAVAWDTKTSNRKYIDETAPHVLTVESLRLGFLTFLIALAVSCIVFVIEMAIEATKFCVSSPLPFA